MATASEFVKKAASQIGVKESPAGSNKVKYAEWYGMNGQPWCDMFVSWCAAQVGASGLVGKFAYCPSHVNYAKKLGQWLDREERPQPGDVVFFSNGTRACHVGVVERRNGTSSVTTIEGNTSVTSNDNGGAVMRRTRSYGAVGSSWYIMGFFRPKWGEATGEAAKTETAKTETTATGDDEVYGFSMVQNGTSGNTVKVCQSALNVRNSARLAVDGAAGSKTVAAIKAWQKKKGLTQDGQCGPKTWAALLGK